jgi:ribosome-associated translation inhibitor RaiA
VTGMIQTLMQHDRTIEPDDIAIIMAKSNDSDIYNQLEDTLDKLYERLGKGKNRVRNFDIFIF